MGISKERVRQIESRAMEKLQIGAGQGQPGIRLAGRLISLAESSRTLIGR